MVAGITHVLKGGRPDIVLSGVNRGQNLGDIMHCSGTAAGAREGALHGAIGIALSQAMDYDHGRDEIDWGPAAELGAETVRSILDVAGARDTYFNVNFPICAPHEVSGIRLVPHQRFALRAVSERQSGQAFRDDSEYAQTSGRGRGFPYPA